MTVELLKNHWFNERMFGPGTILDLPESSALVLIESGGAREIEPTYDNDTDHLGAH